MDSKTFFRLQAFKMFLQHDLEADNNLVCLAYYVIDKLEEFANQFSCQVKDLKSLQFELFFHDICDYNRHAPICAIYALCISLYFQFLNAPLPGNLLFSWTNTTGHIHITPTYKTSDGKD